ncbi:uncharacterized protein [Argopecten irradians]|uniref:uncharacterized protein n=1 Tax=Argopecten irradians TaxID=31199 RepID=UPI003715947B
MYHDKSSKDRTSTLQPGDKVYVKNFAKGPKWLPGKIEAKTGPVSYTVTINEGHTIRRHIDHVRKRTDYGEWNTSSAKTPEVDHEFEPPMVSNEPEVTPSIVTPATPVKQSQTPPTPEKVSERIDSPILNRPTRERKLPNRFKDFVCFPVSSLKIYVNEKQFTWNSAKAICAGTPGQLLVLDNIAKVNKMISEDDLSTNSPVRTGTYWIGLYTDSNTCDSYRWLNGNQFNDTLEWSAAQPKDCVRRQCVQMAGFKLETGDCKTDKAASLCDIASLFNETSPNITVNGTDYDNEYYYDASVYETGDLLYYIVYPILVPIGVIGNFLSFVVLIQLSKDSSFFLYLSVLALSDLSFIIVGALMGWIEVLNQTLFYENISFFLCSVKYALVFVFSQFSSWIIVAVTVDRFIAICFPFKVSVYCTKKRSVMTSLVLFLIICGINFPNICWEWEDNVCVYPEFTLDYCLQYTVMIDLVVYFIAPVCLICVFNIITLRMLYSAMIRRRVIMNRKKKDENERSKSTDEDSIKQTIGILMGVSAVYVLTSLPMAYGSMMAWMEGPQYSPDSTSYLVNVILELCNTVNHSINFILYGISGSLFRKRLLQMVSIFQCRRRRKAGQTQHPYAIRSLKILSTSNDSGRKMDSISSIEVREEPAPSV